MARIALTPEEVRMHEQEIMACNRRHDAKYGLSYDRFGWRTGFEPASPKKDRESIWKYHRSRETVITEMPV
jgi:hypothetical protein